MSGYMSRSSSMECLALLHEMSKHVRIGYLKEWPRITSDGAGPAPSQTAYAFACAFYSTESTPALTVERESTSTPLVAVFNDLTSLSMYSAKALSSDSSNNLSVRETFVQSLVLFKNMTQQLQANTEQVVALAWKPDDWLSAVLECIKSEVFTCIFSDFHKPTVTRLQCFRCLTTRSLRY